MQETLGELLVRCRNGEHDAITALVGRFRPWALHFARALANDNAAEDIVQEAFVAALNGLGSLRTPEAFPAWFRQILRRQAMRASCARHTVPLENAEEVADPVAPVSERMARDEMRCIVRQALNRLPKAEQEAAVRFYLEQLQCAEIAQALRVPQGTVKRRLHDARARLRDMLFNSPSGEPDLSPDLPSLTGEASPHYPQKGFPHER